MSSSQTQDRLRQLQEIEKVCAINYELGWSVLLL